MTETEAFLYVDWNVMAILVSIWTIAGYFGKSGVPEWLSAAVLRLSGGHPGLLVMMLSALAGFVSMVVDNVVVILMFAPVAIPLARQLGIPLTPFILLIGFSANFMGTALLLGDLPPQMLHSVSGAEFRDFLWQFGRPSSFPILTLTFFLTLGAMYLYGFRQLAAPAPAGGRVAAAAGGRGDGVPLRGELPDRLFAFLVLGGFAATILAMAFREVLGVKLGFIALSGALALILLLELLGDRVQKPDFEVILQELDWRAIFFYIALFALVGGLEKTHILEKLAHTLTPLFAQNLALGATLLYWVTVPIVGIVEHDAYILTFLYTIRDLRDQGVEPWPLWWMLVWSGTLGSNLTVAGAPALYAALNICEREEKRKVPLGEFLRWSVPFTILASVICYLLGMLIWVWPYVR
ncbi:MAG: TRAP transporter large permease subunit [Candidatus Rokubacteria bacterium]|nr:TRAP transporter large permease subunit [Candidatus Rokubacteria bacterium]